MALLKLDKERRPRVLLVPPPDLPVPAVQGGAVETLLTHLIRENEKQGQLDLLCASVTDDAARRAAEGWQHTKMLYINRPGGHRRYWPMVFLERCAGIAAPYDPWYQKVQLSLALELPPRLCSWYSWDRQVAILPLPGPGAVMTTSGRWVSM